MARQSRESLPPLRPEGAPEKPGPEDLVLVTPDHRFYWVARDEYRKHEFSIHEGGLYDNLLKAGVTLAQLPPLGDLPKGMGEALCACYLVNLASIQAQKAQQKVRRVPLNGTSKRASARKSSGVGRKRR
ncbi:hypothetical protein F0U59_31035 [Archangium gephyra]|nr:hypothetical protein F0U59_31035 [Archangium gephyra]